jgi:hypothetical protein
MTIALTNKDNQQYALNFIAICDGSTLCYKTDTTMDMVMNQGAPIHEDDYFVISKNSYSHILQLKKIYNTSSTQEIRVRDASIGGDTVSWTHDKSSGSMNYDGNTYPFTLAPGATAIYVEGTADTIITQNGQIRLQLFCTDGALANTCSMITRGYYCDSNGELIEDCQRCGCAAGMWCVTGYNYCAPIGMQ